MSAALHRASSGLQSYDRALWGDWVPELSNVIVAPEMSCLFQRAPLAAKGANETNVPASQTHHSLLFWAQGAPDVNFDLGGTRQRGRMDRWDSVHIPAGQTSWWESTAQTADSVFHLHVSKHVVDKVLEAHLDRQGQQAPEFSDGGRLQSPRLKQIAAMVHAYAQTLQAPSKLLWESYAVLIAHYLVSAVSVAAQLPRGGLAPRQVRRCTDFISDHAEEDIGLEQLASLTGLSMYHFARAFKRSTGLAPHRYQLMVRIERAKVLLSETDASVTEIAFRVGYESSQALARVFRRDVGVSPSDYRRQHRL